MSEDFIKRIVEFSGGYFNEEELRSIFYLIENETKKYFFTPSSESNLLRFISATYDKVSFLSDCLKYPYYIELLLSITSNSNYLTDILVRNPEYFYLIANPSNLDKINSEIDYKEGVRAQVSLFQSLGSRLNALRRYKRREILRIGVKDIFLKKDIEEITNELSCLARVLTSELFSICYNNVINKYHLIIEEKRYCLVSFGKLGGNELNYSSDIDLIIFYDENDILPNGKEFQEILTEAVLLFIESASSITENGYLYRVDFRLRPDGKNSPLCRRLSDYLIYYESRGEDWERQMLIKSDFVAGSEELFDKFQKYLTPFIFPASFTTSPIEQIKILKSNTERNLQNNENIKLAPGGIRNIEFSVQALQLLNGGRVKSLRTGNTLLALRELQMNNLLTEDESNTLKNAYIFYRKTEHYLQLMNDIQTHLIPSGGELLYKLAMYLGFRNVKDFIGEVGIKRKRVNKIYNSVMGKEDGENVKTGISDIRFSNFRTAERDWIYLKKGKGLLGKKEFDNHSIEAFNKISGHLIKYLKHSDDPDMVLNNFVRIIRQAKFPSIWYDEFRNKSFFKAFLRICEYSQFSVDLFAEDKSLREIFLSKKIFNRIDITESLLYKEFIYRLTTLYTLDLVKTEKISIFLTAYFNKRINDLSGNLDQNQNLINHYFIGAMGSFGISEMTFTSDIDLIFITDNLMDNPDQQTIFTRFLAKLREEFSPVTVDCRLRPEGKSGMLVWDINSYHNYISSRARTWELQAFTKLRFIAGNKKLFNRIARNAAKRLRSESLLQIRSELKDMRRKVLSVSDGIYGIINLKKAAGGITDIEFIAQYLILCNPHLFQKLRAKNIKSVMNNLIRNTSGHDDSLNLLSINYRFLKSLIHQNQNIFHQTGGVIVLEAYKFDKLALRMGFASHKELEKKLMQVLKENSSLINKIFRIQL